VAAENGFFGRKTMRRIVDVHVVISFVLIVAISTDSFAQTTQPQGPVREPQKVEQPVENKEQLNRELISAVMRGQKEKAEELLSLGADVNTRFGAGTSLLHFTAVRGRKDAVNLLLANGALVNAKNDKGLTPLHWVAGAVFPQWRHPEMVKILLTNGADVNAADNQGLTPIHHAAKTGRESIAKTLIDKGADVNVQDSYGLTALHYTVTSGREDIIRLLLGKKGIAIDARDNSGRTAFHYAARAGFGANYAYKEFPAAIAQLLLDSGADVNAKDAMGQTSVFNTFHKPDNDALRFLVARGADLYCVDNRGYTPLSYVNATIYFLAGYLSAPAWQEYRQALRETAGILRTLMKEEYRVFVAPDGDDTNSGALNSPFKTITAALDVVGPGDSIVVRGGVHHCLRTIYVNRSGTRGRPIRVVAYPGETPILDFSKTRGYAFLIEAAYCHFKSLTLAGMKRGMILYSQSAHHNVYEQLTVCGNRQGVKLLGGMEGAAYNMIINCDAYDNCDFNTHGGGGDGIRTGNGIGPGNILIGNRSWCNSDDGYDCWNADNPLRFENCYAWSNGINIWDVPYFKGDGNGFKLGGGEGRHILVNCFAWKHTNGFGAGFTPNGNAGGPILRKCSAWSNKINYEFASDYWESRGGAQEECVFHSNLSFACRRKDKIDDEAESQQNTWDDSTGITLTTDDFLSLDDSQMSAPRNPDGSIPYNNFLRLAPDSAAIDAGVDVNMPYHGKAPDLGAYEYDPDDTPEDYIKMLHQAVRDHDVEEINKLLAAGEGINDKDWLGYTPLHWAVYFGYADLIELLVSKGADPNIQSDTGRYALEISRAMAYPELEALLLKHGAKEQSDSVTCE